MTWGTSVSFYMNSGWHAWRALIRRAHAVRPYDISDANTFLSAGAGRPDFSTNAISSTPSWCISSGAWVQYQPAPRHRALDEQMEKGFGASYGCPVGAAVARRAGGSPRLRGRQTRTYSAA